MLNTAKLKKHLSAGNPTKYEKQKHIELLVDLFCNGESITAFCDEAMINRKTFYNWLRDHKEFKEAYEIVINTAERWWERYALNNSQGLNFQHWYMIMKNRFGWCKTRVELSGDSTPKGRIDAIWKAVEAGELTTDEIAKLASLALAQLNIENNGTTQQAESQRLSREELYDYIQKLEIVKEHLKPNALEQVGNQS